MSGSERMSNDSPQAANLRRAHPLALALIERIGTRGALVLDFGTGRGRNAAALRDAGLTVHAIDDADVQTAMLPPATYNAALGTHALLHGTPSIVARMLAGIARALRPDAPFYCTFASKRDSRYGNGIRLDEDTYAPQEGDEASVAHVYFDGTGLREALQGQFAIESLSETNAQTIVGSWAHAVPPEGTVHWFVRARKRALSKTC